MQARGFLNYRLKYCWSEVNCCVCQTNELNGILRQNWRGQTVGQAKIWGGHDPPKLPLRTATAARWVGGGKKVLKLYCLTC